MKTFTCMLLLCLSLSTLFSQTHEIAASNSDGYVSDPGVILVNNPYTQGFLKIGKSAVDGSANCTSGILPFQLPDLPAGKEISAASLTVYVSYGREWFNSYIDLYGLAYKSTPEISSSDYFTGAFGDGTGNGADHGIEDDFFTKNVSPGTLDTPRFEVTSASGNAALVDYLKQQYVNGASQNDYVFLRLSVDNDEMTGSQYFKVDGGADTHPAILSISITDIGGNQIPILNKIGDQQVTEGISTQLSISANDGDGDLLLFSATNLPSFAQLTDSANGRASLLIDASAGDAGYYENIEISVSDGADLDSENFTIEVLEPADPMQKMNLDASTNDRFSLSEPDWPENIGEAAVCLWHDDKYAAASISIDDNIESDHSWWLGMQEEYELNFTWFLITDRISDWSKYQTLVNKGNEVQGHDDCDINDFGKADYHAALENTRDLINVNVSGNNCTSYAYPCGLSDKLDVARKTYISIRGVAGLMNKANRINYLNVNSRSAVNDIHDIKVLLDENEKLYNVSYNRGWLCYHYHSISSIKPATEAYLSYLSTKKDSIWIGMFSEVAKYGQERDTHTLTMHEVADSLIEFSLGDEMDDNYFDFPLSVKIRVPDQWNAVVAFQEEEIETSLVIHEGKKYAIVKAVPDRGLVQLRELRNSPPVLEAIEWPQIEESSSMTIQINASDEDNDPMTLTTENLPDFCSFTDNNNSSGSLVISPQPGDAGIYSDVVIIASDAYLYDKDSITITVTELNFPPELEDLQAHEMYEDSILQIDLLATDENDDIISLSAINLPTFATFADLGNGNGQLLFNPKKGDAGSYENITIFASDGEFEDSASFDLSVFINTGISLKYKDQALTIFPNPAQKGQIHILLPDGDQTDMHVLKIYNALGDLVHKAEFSMRASGIYPLDISKLGPGQFVIKHMNGGKSKSAVLLVE